MFVIICIFVVFWPYIILLLNGRDTSTTFFIWRICAEYYYNIQCILKIVTSVDMLSLVINHEQICYNEKLTYELKYSCMVIKVSM